ncbi:MAG: winged helix-turn-helix domain-containing protein [Polyangia bacterium]|jgi:hypothetical protein
MNKSWKEAIIEVLEAEGQAMHYADIAEEIQRRKLRSSFGATPANTVYTVLYESIKKDGDDAPFVKSGVGEFMLQRAATPSKKSGRTPVSQEAEEFAETGGIIKAFGMFWRREWVDWTSRPKLMGVQQEGAKPVDFAEQKGVYLLHDGREVVYVGRMTEKRLAARLFEHTKDRLNGRWDRFSWFGLLDVTDAGALTERALSSLTADDVITTMEALLIEGLEPRQNRKRGDAFRAVEYLQHLDPELAKKAKRKLAEEILSKL